MAQEGGCQSILRATKKACGGRVREGETRCHKHRVYGRAAGGIKKKSPARVTIDDPPPEASTASLPDPPPVPDILPLPEKSQPFARLAESQLVENNERDVSAFLDPSGASPDTADASGTVAPEDAEEDDDLEGDIESTKALFEIAFYGMSNAIENSSRRMKGLSQALYKDKAIDNGMRQLAKKYAKPMARYSGPGIVLALASARCGLAVYETNRRKEMLAATLQPDTVTVSEGADVEEA